MTAWRLAWLMLRREWRAGELRVLALAVVVAVASVAAVGFIADRITQALQIQANELLGGDVVISSPDPISDELLADARQRGLRTTRTLGFASMAVANDHNEMVSLLAVESGYPLRGEVRVARELFGRDQVATGIPGAGEVWLEGRILTAMGLQVGDTLQLGVKTFRITAVITSEAARAGGSFFSLAPRAMIDFGDVPATGLVTPASRVRYGALLAGDGLALSQWRKRWEKNLPPGLRLQGIEDARPEVRSSVEKGERFLGLAALVSVVLAVTAVLLSARRFVERHLLSVAVLRCLGARERMVLLIFGLQVGWIGLLASVTGVLVGYAVHFLLISAVQAWFGEVSLPLPGWRAGWLGGFTGLIAVLGFVMPAIWQLRQVPVVAVLRRSFRQLPLRMLRYYGPGWLLLAGLAVWQAGDLRLGLWIIGSTALTALLLAGVAYGLLRVVRYGAVGVGVSWRFGLYNLQRRAGSSVVQIIGFGIGCMALLILTFVRGDLLEEWQARLPADTPNRFLINIQPDQVDGLQAFIQQNLHETAKILPMIRGRLVAINGREVNEDEYAGERAKRLLAREFNLSWAAELQADNKIVAGKWFQPDGGGSSAWSVEEGLAKELGLHVGDTLRFRIAEQTVEGTIANLRGVEWDTFRVNFFVIAPPKMLDNMPRTYITSFYLPDGEGQLLNKLLREYPNITIIDVAAVMSQVQKIIARLASAIQYVFVFTLMAGLLVMYAAIQSTLDARYFETAILRTIGAHRRQIYQGLVAEFLVLGVIAGFVAAALASVTGAVIARKIFEFDYHWDPVVWIVGILGSGLLVMIAGVLGTRQVVGRPPLATLRRVG